jgi:phenylacetate-coenzyme A ligase PaaK-like adenylate-forming protein
MKIIGKVLKKTAEIGYKRTLNKGLEFSHQIETLQYLVDHAKKTNFGKNHHFSKLLAYPNLIKAYQKEVPIVEYEEFYQTWLHRSIDGVKDHTWPGQIKYYALSSGTTGSPSKRIPVTDEMIKSFQKTSMKQITTLHELNLDSVFFQKSVLVVGGSTKLEKVQNHIEGDLSGILKKHTSWIASPFAKPKNSTAKIKDWNVKMDEMVNQAPSWDIGIVAGVPSWCIMLMERVIERYNLNSIHDIWPNFQVYIHGGVFMQPYLNRFDRVCGKKVHLLDTYLASEGYFAYQRNTENKSMRLLLNTGVFFEFIPFNEQYFSSDSKVSNKYEALTLEDVQEGVDYALVISTNAGLWRYVIGDLIRFTDVEKREIKITGRIKQYLSLVGEHISLDNINEALEFVCKKQDVDVQEFGVYCDTENLRHCWNIGTETTIDAQAFLEEFDKKLGELNDDYRSVRKYSLNQPIINQYPTQYFYDFMAALGKLGSQNKFPRVMNQHQASEWKRFIEEK